MFGGNAFYDVYEKGEAYWKISPAADQNAAGAIMMVEGSFLTICLFAGCSSSPRARPTSARSCSTSPQARGYELTEQRAARAVAAGRGADLRARIEGSTS